MQIRPKWLLLAVPSFWLFCFLVLGRTGNDRRPGSRQLAEQLASRLSSEQLNKHTAAQLRIGFQTAIGASNASGQPGEALQKEPSLTMQLHNVVQQLTYDQSAVRCWSDPSMQLDLHLGQQKVLLAANMHNNEELLPHYITQLTHLLSVLPPGSTFLSIYESDSSDSTGVPCTEQLVDAVFVYEWLHGGARTIAHSCTAKAQPCSSTTKLHALSVEQAHLSQPQASCISHLHSHAHSRMTTESMQACGWTTSTP